MISNKIVSLLFVWLLFSNGLSAQTDHLATVKFPDHPRILMLKGEEAIIKKNIAADKTWAKIHNAIITESDNLITVEPIKRIQIGRRLLDKSREALRRLFMLSYAYRMTEQQKYLDRAEKEMLTIAAFSDWNPTHFLDVAEMTMAVSIGYDWLFNGLSPNSRQIIREAIIKKGIEPSQNSKYNSWLKAEHNWNQVCNAGMSYGALAIYEVQPQLSKEIINRAIGSIVLAMKDYGPDGAYPEGYGYWGYGTSFNVMFNSAMEKAFGSDFGLNSQPGFLKTAGFMENMTGTTGKPFNYSDAGSEGGLHPAMFWFANKIKDPSVLWVERQRLMNDDSKKFVKDRLLPAIMLWGGGMSIDKITPPKSTMWVAQGKNPVALMRTSWTDTNGIYVGMKGGSVSVNHAHMDVGSFVMDANGVRWAMDFGSQEYESLESKGIQLFGRTQDAQRWTVFRLTNLVHNTLTFNGQHQRVTGHAPINSSSDKPAFMNAVSDLSEVYTGQVAKAVRGVGIVNKQYVVVRDEIQTLPTETTLRWTMLTPASVKITSANTAELTKDGKKLLLKVQEPATVTMKTWSTDPPHDYDAPNPGTTLVGFEVKLPANSKNNVSVALIPGADEKTTVQKIQPLQNWDK
ncbi:MAG TPA: heparinase II/III family protein [Segetibacter sp.]|nr:heparinase II/III family protein [Segetibacter sp.]